MEVEDELLQAVLVKHADEKPIGLYNTTAVGALADCNIYIVTVPTPTDKYNRPVLTPMIKASETIAGLLKKGDVVLYESTVYPGVTEEEMVPVLSVFRD